MIGQAWAWGMLTAFSVSMFVTAAQPAGMAPEAPRTTAVAVASHSRLAAAAGRQVDVGQSYHGAPVTLGGTLATPEGVGPFPVVVLLHGCSGLNGYAQRRSDTWAGLLRARGYATYTLDSFSGRGLTDVCSGGPLNGRERAGDVLAAGLALADQPDIDVSRLVVMGFSHGAWTTLHALAANEPALADARQRFADRGGAVAGGIALYPPCRDTERQTFVAPLLVLIGRNDDWTPATACEALAATPRPATPPVQLVVYPNAHHDFDVPGPVRTSHGHTLAHDPEATADARQRVAAFLDALAPLPTAAAQPDGGMPAETPAAG